MAPAANNAALTGHPRARIYHALIRHLLPSLSVMLAAATLFYCLFVFDATSQLYRDSDTGWHLRNGESILDSGTLPRTDPYSFSKPDAPWVAWEWGSDVLMAVAFRTSGFYGLTLLFSLTIVAVVWLAARLHLAAGGDFLLTALCAIPMVTTSSLHWLARPHVFGWLFLLATVLYAERAPLRFGWRQILMIGLGSALWANIHGSFFLGAGIAVVYSLTHLLRPLIWDVDAHADRMRARWYAFAALVSLLGSGINPYGFSLHAHIAAYLTDRELTSRIAEFQSFNFFDREALQVALTVALASAGAVLALSQKRLAHFALILLLVWGGLRSARVLPLVALVALPLANGAISEALRRVTDLRPALRRALVRVLGYSSGLRRIDDGITGTAFFATIAALSLIILHVPALQGRAGFAPDRFPVAAAAEVAKLPASARIYSPDAFGGYLIYRFPGDRKVFFDGRSDFYGVAFMKDYLTLSQARPGWQEIAKRYQFTHALLPKDATLAGALASQGWVERYQDNTATLWEAP